ncbi:unnamed protein product [Hymenolepis diminuta]|uniref:Uncharacterized protein n=1 Tax=Hymenolepis diminuta TaxID=6216 RepID=A0A0R3SXI0_HYMDI|nr:unnamed protein product [Hymenolepis diminuta]
MHEGSRPSKSGTEGPLHFETQDDKSWRQVQSVCKCNSRRVGEKTWGATTSLNPDLRRDSLPRFGSVPRTRR